MYTDSGSLLAFSDIVVGHFLILGEMTDIDKGMNPLLLGSDPANTHI